MFGTDCRLDTHVAYRTFKGNQYKRNQNLQENKKSVAWPKHQKNNSLYIKKTLPCDAEADRAHVGQYVIEQVVASASRLQVDVEFSEFKLDVIYVMEE